MTQYSTPKITIDLEEYNELLEYSKTSKGEFTPEEMYQVFRSLFELINPQISHMLSEQDKHNKLNRDMANINLKVNLISSEGKLIIERIR